MTDVLPVFNPCEPGQMAAAEAFVVSLQADLERTRKSSVCSTEKPKEGEVLPLVPAVPAPGPAFTGKR